MAFLSAEAHEFVPTLLTPLSALIAFGAPVTAVCSTGLQHFRDDFEFLEYGFYKVFVAFLLASSLSLTTRELTIENLFRESVVIRPYHMSNPSELPSSKLTF